MRDWGPWAADPISDGSVAAVEAIEGAVAVDLIATFEPQLKCCAKTDAIDVHNGLFLSALWGAAFDAGLVSFGNDGTVLASRKLSTASQTSLSVEKAPRLPNLRDAHCINLAAHRARHGFSATSSTSPASLEMRLGAS